MRCAVEERERADELPPHLAEEARAELIETKEQQEEAKRSGKAETRVKIRRWNHGG